MIKNVHVKVDLEDKIFDKSLNINNELNYWITNQSFDFDTVLSMRGIGISNHSSWNNEVENGNTFVSEQPKKKKPLKDYIKSKKKWLKRNLILG